MRNVSTSGVGSQSRYLFQGLLNTGKYSVKQFGGAMKHTNPNVVMVPPYGADFVILPVSGSSPLFTYFATKYPFQSADAAKRPVAPNNSVRSTKTDIIRLIYNPPNFLILIIVI